MTIGYKSLAGCYTSRLALPLQRFLDSPNADLRDCDQTTSVREFSVEVSREFARDIFGVVGDNVIFRNRPCRDARF